MRFIFFYLCLALVGLNAQDVITDTSGSSPKTAEVISSPATTDTPKLSSEPTVQPSQDAPIESAVEDVSEVPGPAALESTDSEAKTTETEQAPATPAEAVDSDTANKAPAKPIPTKTFGPGVAKEKRKQVGKPDVGISMIRYVITMVIVLCLLGGVFYVLKRVGNKLGGNGFGSLSVIQRLQLDGKNTLVLVRHHEDEVLLAIGPQGTTLISRSSSLEGTVDDLDNTPEGLESVPTQHVTEDNSIMSKIYDKISAAKGGVKG